MKTKELSIIICFLFIFVLLSCNNDKVRQKDVNRLIITQKEINETMPLEFSTKPDSIIRPAI